MSLGPPLTPLIMAGFGTTVAPGGAGGVDDGALTGEGVDDFVDIAAVLGTWMIRGPPTVAAVVTTTGRATAGTIVVAAAAVVVVVVVVVV